jgi:hypothetical protein
MHATSPRAGHDSPFSKHQFTKCALVPAAKAEKMHAKESGMPIEKCAGEAAGAHNRRREEPMNETQAPIPSVAPPGTGGLPPPVPRRHAHTRAVAMQGFRRNDGLWDIEGEMKDSKTTRWPSWERGMQPPEAPVHHMRVRVTLDDSFTVLAIAAPLPTVPFPECAEGMPPLQGLVGASMSRGWRKAIDATLGGALGCTHLRELLMNLGTVAYQTVAGETRREEWEALPDPHAGLPDPTSPRPHWGKCVGWRLDGEVIRRWAPDFFQPSDQPSE